MEPEAYDEAVGLELMKGPRMKAVCAWHVKYFGVEKVMREAEPGAGPGVTHSICEECRAKFNEQALAKSRSGDRRSRVKA